MKTKLTKYFLQADKSVDDRTTLALMLKGRKNNLTDLTEPEFNWLLMQVQDKEIAIYLNNLAVPYNKLPKINFNRLLRLEVLPNTPTYDYLKDLLRKKEYNTEILATSHGCEFVFYADDNYLSGLVNGKDIDPNLYVVKNSEVLAKLHIYDHPNTIRLIGLQMEADKLVITAGKHWSWEYQKNPDVKLIEEIINIL